MRWAGLRLGAAENASAYPRLQGRSWRGGSGQRSQTLTAQSGSGTNDNGSGSGDSASGGVGTAVKRVVKMGGRCVLRWKVWQRPQVICEHELWGGRYVQCRRRHHCRWRVMCYSSEAIWPRLASVTYSAQWCYHGKSPGFTGTMAQHIVHPVIRPSPSFQSASELGNLGLLAPIIAVRLIFPWATPIVRSNSIIYRSPRNIKVERGVTVSVLCPPSLHEWKNSLNAMTYCDH